MVWYRQPLYYSQLSSNVGLPIWKEKYTTSLTTKRRMPHPFESSSAWHRDWKLMPLSFIQLTHNTFNLLCGPLPEALTSTLFMTWHNLIAAWGLGIWHTCFRKCHGGIVQFRIPCSFLETVGFLSSRRNFCTGTRLTLYWLSFRPLHFRSGRLLSAPWVEKSWKMDQEKGKASKTRKHGSRWKECAAAECNSFEYNSDGSVFGLHFFKFLTNNPAKARRCNLIKRQHGREGLRVGENTVICEKHFRKHEIIKGVGGVRCRLGKGLVLFTTVIL